MESREHVYMSPSSDPKGGEWWENISLLKRAKFKLLAWVRFLTGKETEWKVSVKTVNFVTKEIHFSLECRKKTEWLGFDPDGTVSSCLVYLLCSKYTAITENRRHGWPAKQVNNLATRNGMGNKRWWTEDHLFLWCGQSLEANVRINMRIYLWKDLQKCTHFRLPRYQNRSLFSKLCARDTDYYME